ncbi:unnamed protein product [Boreogadus saida]
MQRCAYLCSEVNGEGNDLEVDGPKRQEARVQEEGHGLLLSPRQAMLGEQAGMGVVKQSLCLSGHIASYHYNCPSAIVSDKT